MVFLFPQKGRASVSTPFVALLMTVVVAIPVTTAQTLSTSRVVSNPTVSGPILSTGIPGDSAHNYIFYSTPMALMKVGYVEQEYFISGTATRYVVSDEPGAPTSIGTMPYQTRIVVRRPADAKRFSGVVVVDWQNVTAGFDLDTEWAQAGDFFVRAGWAWVGASVQRIGVHGFNAPSPLAGRGLKQWSPARYASLDVTNGGAVTDDSQSYDIYSQVAEMLKHPQGVNPFEGMRVQRVYAAGASQSANFLVRYYNSIQPHAKRYDGFLVSIGGGRPRLDENTKFFKVITETEVGRGQATVRAPDTESTHTWEITGSPHMSSDLMSMDKTNFRTVLGGILDRDIGLRVPVSQRQCVRPHPSDVEAWVVHSASYAALDRWVTKNVPPSASERINVSAAPTPPGAPTIVRDDKGFAVGGIRLPRVAVPTALNTGENLPANTTLPENNFCSLYGTHIPFDAATLRTLYQTREAYLREVRRAVEGLVKQGFVLEHDAPTLIRNAETADFGR